VANHSRIGTRRNGHCLHGPRRQARSQRRAKGVAAGAHDADRHGPFSSAKSRSQLSLRIRTSSPLIDSGSYDGLPYLITPYVARESLPRATRS
jgi:hypothetical protein